MKRRDILKIAGAGGAMLLTGNAAAKTHETSSNGDAFGVLVDTTVCIGCRKCEWACNQTNTLTTKDSKAFEDKSVCKTHRRPSDDAFTVVNAFDGRRADGEPSYMKIQCMHCDRPACVSACLVGALQKNHQGPVTYDPWKCMGCRYCMVACPFQIPAYEYSDPLTPRVRKCTFCAERLAQGKRPGCVEICPNEALMFGKRSELVDLAYSRIRQFPGRYVDHVYGEHEAGGTSWMYLAPVDFVKTELPALESKPMPEYTETIQHGVFKWFIPPVLLYGLLGLSMVSSKKDDRSEKEDGHDA
jgi:formate dehydrogenase iron-sulfur subunit